MGVKFCGLRHVDDVRTACDLGASYIAFNFFAPSPRFVSIDEASALARAVPAGAPVKRVALVVNASDDDIAAIVGEVAIDVLQLHGEESSARVRDVTARFGLPVIKAISIANAADLDQIDDYAPLAQQILIDAKSTANDAMPGGNGVMFDWRLLHQRPLPNNWMLAGGLTPGNVAEAINLTNARHVDVSSGIERAPGVKDHALMAAFMQAVRGA